MGKRNRRTQGNEMKKQHLSNKGLHLTRASSYCMKKGLLKGATSPAKLKLVCSALLTLHPQYSNWLPMKKKEDCWRFLFFVCAELGINVIPKKEKFAQQRQELGCVPAKCGVVTISAPPPPVDFYYSREWRALRYRVLREYGPRCQCCGATPANAKQIHVDHIKPRSKFPHLELEFTNLQVLCEDCNMGKSNIDDTDWRPVVTEELDEQAAAHIYAIK